MGIEIPSPRQSWSVPWVWGSPWVWVRVDMGIEIPSLRQPCDFPWGKTDHKLILSSKKEYYSSLISSASDNPKRLWQTVNKLLHRKSSSPLPTSSPGTSLADSFASFSTGKISKLRLSLTRNPATSSPHSPPPPATPPNFSVFTPVSESEVHKILSNCPNKQSE